MFIKKNLQDKKFYYLAYGSNLNLYHMSNMSEGARVVGTTILNGYRLVFKGSAEGYAYLTLEEYPGASVPIGIYSMPMKDMKTLDNYESYPRLYDRFTMPVIIDGKKEDTYIYIMKPGFDYHLPSESYLIKCEEGYEDFGFDYSFLDQALQTTKDNISSSLTKRLTID
jgi:AIG2 family protein